MHIFVTGATGWVGSAVVGELVAAGHSVLGLARDASKAAAVAAAEAEPIIGTLDHLEVLRDAASMADAVIHTAFDHDFSRFAANSEQEARALEAIGDAMRGLNQRLIVTSGVALVAPGQVVSEDDVPAAGAASPRKAETIARALAERGIRASTIRLAPTVHGVGDRGFIPILIGIAREKGISAYVGDGMNRWPAVHRKDVARLYRLAVEHADPTFIYHAIAEEGIAFRNIAEAIGRHLDVPVEPRDSDHFGWFGMFAGADIPASSDQTRALLDWAPTMPGLIADLARPDYVGL